jgi:hypothetical protein
VPDRNPVQQAPRAVLGDDAFTQAYQRGLLVRGTDSIRELAGSPQRTG